MTSYYVDATSGLDTNPGTYSQPWKTIDKVNSIAFSPGDYIYFKCGEIWREVLTITHSGSNSNLITYSSYGSGDLPTINGSDIFTSWTLHSGSVWKTNVTNDPRLVIFDGIVGNLKTALVDVDSEYDFYWASGVVYVYSSGGNPNTVYTNPGVEIPNARFRGIWTNDIAGINYIALENIKVYGVGRWDSARAINNYRSEYWDFNKVTVEKCNAGGMYLPGSKYQTINGCTITGERMLPTYHHGIFMVFSSTSYQPEHNTITNSSITNWNAYSIAIGGSSYTYRASYNEVSHNDLSHSSTGCYLMESDHCTVFDNTCDDNVRGGHPTAERYGIAFETVSNSEVYDNTCTNGLLGMEIWSGPDVSFPNSGDSHYNKIHHNIFAGNSMYGFYVYTGNVTGTEFYNNLIYENGYDGVGLNEMRVGYESTNCVCYNNTFYRNSATESSRADMAMSTALPGWTFKNNLAYNTNKYCLRCTSSPSFVHTDNCYYRSSGTVILKGSTTYDLAHVTDFEATAIASDPLFVDAGNDNFDIQYNSPCINAGVDVGLTVDFDYNPIVGNPDIGAYEYTEEGNALTIDSGAGKFKATGVKIYTP